MADKKKDKEAKSKHGGHREGAGRKPVELDWEEALELAEMQCTKAEIAHWFRIHPDTLNARCRDIHGVDFSIWYEKASSKGKSSLRRKMFQIALGGNTSMCIWLSKQYLNMKDQPDEIFEQKPTIIKTKDGVEIKLGFNKDKGKNNDGD